MTHPSHATRISDSSLYDEVCTNCGVTDADGMAKLNAPCRSPLLKVEPPRAWPPPPTYVGITRQEVEAAVASPGRHATVLIEGPLGSFLMLDHVKAGQYRFPGGRLEDGEVPMAAAARELKEELGIELRAVRLLTEKRHHVSGRDWIGYYFICTEYSGTPRVMEPAKHRGIKYLTLAEMRAELASDLVHASDYEIANKYHYPRG